MKMRKAWFLKSLPGAPGPRRLGVGLLLLVAVGSAAFWLWDHRGYWLCDNLREVEPGRIYAGGFQYPIPLRRIIDRYHIKTVLSLREGDDSHETEELKVLAERGVQFRKVAIPYKVSDDVRIARIEEAISVMTDAQNWPVYVHCWAGCHRTGAVVAIYRVSRCGWSEEAARTELVDWGGTALGTQWPTRLLHAYCLRSREIVASKDDNSGLQRN